MLKSPRVNAQVVIVCYAMGVVLVKVARVLVVRALMHRA